MTKVKKFYSQKERNLGNKKDKNLVFLLKGENFPTCVHKIFRQEFLVVCVQCVWVLQGVGVQRSRPRAASECAVETALNCCV